MSDSEKHFVVLGIVKSGQIDLENAADQISEGDYMAAVHDLRCAHKAVEMALAAIAEYSLAPGSKVS